MFNYVIHVLEIFCLLNFCSLWRHKHFFNSENFSNYGRSGSFTLAISSRLMCGYKMVQYGLMVNGYQSNIGCLSMELHHCRMQIICVGMLIQICLNFTNLLKFHIICNTPYSIHYIFQLYSDVVCA